MEKGSPAKDRPLLSVLCWRGCAGQKALQVSRKIDFRFCEFLLLARPRGGLLLQRVARLQLHLWVRPGKAAAMRRAPRSIASWGVGFSVAFGQDEVDEFAVTERIKHCLASSPPRSAASRRRALAAAAMQAEVHHRLSGIVATLNRISWRSALLHAHAQHHAEVFFVASRHWGSPCLRKEKDGPVKSRPLYCYWPQEPHERLPWRLLRCADQN